MKCIIAFPVILCFISTHIFAQSSVDPTVTTDFWEYRLLGQDEIKHKRIQSIEIEGVGISTMRGGGNMTYRYGKSYVFDNDGRLLRSIEMEGADTSVVNTYKYTSQGNLCWKLTEDRSWNKKYKTGYRFNQNATIFQVKFYEVVNDYNAMLLDTRNYIYYPEKDKSEVRFLEHNRLIKTKMSYKDPQGNQVEEWISGANNELIKRTTTKIRPDKQPERIILETDQKKEEYLYNYDETGKLSEISLVEDGTLKEKAIYLFNDNGLLVKSFRDINTQGRRPEVVIEYKYNYRD